MGGFLFAGLIVVILASIAAMFVPAMQVGVSAVAALLFSGFILYDYEPSGARRRTTTSWRRSACT